MHTKYLVVDYVVDREVDNIDPHHAVKLRDAILKDHVKWFEGNHGDMRVAVCGYKDKLAGNSVGKLMINLMSAQPLDNYRDAEYYVHASLQEIDGHTSVKHELKRHHLFEIDLSGRDDHQCDNALADVEEDLLNNPDMFIGLVDCVTSLPGDYRYQITNCKDHVITVKLLTNSGSIRELEAIQKRKNYLPRYNGTYIYFKIVKARNTVKTGCDFEPPKVPTNIGDQFNMTLPKLINTISRSNIDLNGVMFVSDDYTINSKGVFLGIGSDDEEPLSTLDDDAWKARDWTVVGIRLRKSEIDEERIEGYCGGDE